MDRVGKNVLNKSFWNWSETCVQFDCFTVQMTEVQNNSRINVERLFFTL